MRNIETLTLDRFGSDNIKLSDLGKTIQQLSGSQIRELVLTNVRSVVKQIDDRILNMNDFSIKNASVIRLVVTGVLLSYAGSIRRAFPSLVSFCGVQNNRHTEETRPTMIDLVFLSDTIVNFAVYLSKDRESQPVMENYITLAKITELLSYFEKYDRDFSSYWLNSPKSDDCLCNMRFKLGARLSTMTINELPFVGSIMLKPACVDENNTLEYLDICLLYTSPSPRD